VVIPEEVRKRLKLKEGSQFVVLDYKDTVMLKIISEPSPEEFQKTIESFRDQVKKAGAKKSEVGAAVRSARRNK
jgi:AbrB family looped-hinge helix DNA binding protein